MSHATDTPTERPTTDMGRGGDKKWPYTRLSSDDIDAHLVRLGAPTTYADARADSVTIQPSNVKPSEDRLTVQIWNLPGGTWTFAAVLDGHSGDATVNHAIATIPGDIRARLAAALERDDADMAHIVPDVIQAALTSFEEGILADFMALFPGGLDQLKTMSDDEVKAIVNDSDANHTKALRCMRGTTVLVALVDPERKNIWVASLGDGQAILSSKDISSDVWRGTALGGVHNGYIGSEVERVRAEHPGEEGAIMNGFVVGALMVTRALGDEHFKLDLEWMKRVFMLVSPGFNFSKRRPEFYFPRYLTPPYVSSTAEIRHHTLDRAKDRFIILSSDGLTDLFSPDGGEPVLSPEATNRIAKIVGQADTEDTNLSLKLLREGFGGEDLDRASRNLTVEMEGMWIDDTTVIVLRL